VLRTGEAEGLGDSRGKVRCQLRMSQPRVQAPLPRRKLGGGGRELVNDEGESQKNSRLYAARNENHDGPPTYGKRLSSGTKIEGGQTRDGRSLSLRQGAAAKWREQTWVLAKAKDVIPNPEKRMRSWNTRSKSLRRKRRAQKKAQGATHPLCACRYCSLSDASGRAKTMGNS